MEGNYFRYLQHILSIPSIYGLLFLLHNFSKCFRESSWQPISQPPILPSDSSNKTWDYTLSLMEVKKDVLMNMWKENIAGLT